MVDKIWELLSLPHYSVLCSPGTAHTRPDGTRGEGIAEFYIHHDSASAVSSLQHVS